MKGKIRQWVAGGVFVLGLVSIGVDAYLKQHADGRIVLIAPPAQAVAATVDGTRYDLPAGSHRRIALPHGKHQVHVEGAGSVDHTVEITSGRDNIAVPTSPEQCFAELDVTLSHYGPPNTKLPPPKVIRRERHNQPWQLFSEYALDESELPESAKYERDLRDGKITHMELVFLYQAIDCRMIEASDKELLASIGFDEGR